MLNQSALFMYHKITPFWYLGILSAFSLLTFDLYQPALPTITQYFNTTPASGQLTLSLFFFVFGLAQLIWGPLVDHYGRKKILRISLSIFLLATLGCIAANSIQMLIAARILQGFSVCCCSIIGFSSSRDYEDDKARARILSYIAMIVSISPIFAPLVGSIIFSYYGWHATFITMALIGLVLILLSELVLYESPFWKEKEEHFQLVNSWLVFKKLFKHRQLGLSTAIVTASYSCVILIIVNAAYLIIDNLHYSPLIFSLLFGLNGITLIIGNYLGVNLREKKSLTWNIYIGTLMMVLSSLLLLILFYTLGLKLISLAPILILCLAINITNPPAFSLGLSEFKEHAGTVSAFMNTIRTTISATVGAITGFAIPSQPNLLAISLLICSLICWLVSLFITDSK